MTDEEKWQYLSEIPASDAEHIRIKHLSQLLRMAAGDNNIRYAQLCMTVARDWIRQTSDVNRTGGEDIAGLTRAPTTDDAIDALKRGEDDCDAKARLFVALCLAGGLQAAMVPKWNMVPSSELSPNGRTLTHVSAKVQINSKWHPVELTLSRARLGEPGEQVPKEIDTKRWRLS